LLSFGPKIRAAVESRPDGLLLHENLLYSLVPPHAGMRQYWRDFDSLERWARSLPHRNGGKVSYATEVAPVSGTKHTSATAAWNPFTSTWHRWDLPSSHRWNRLVAHCSRPVGAYACKKTPNSRRASPRTCCTDPEGGDDDLFFELALTLVHTP
jgi:Domain of unknown function (DUF4188)